MIDSSLPEGEWEEYPLGEISGSERRRFETRLTTQPELRSLARELEEGMLALALSAPQRPAPPEAWRNIQAAINPRWNWSLWLSLAGLKWVTHGRLAAASLTTVCILHFVSPYHATTRVAEAAPARQIAEKPLARTEDTAENTETRVASTAENQTERPPQKTDQRTIQSAVWPKAPAAKSHITPLPAYTITPGQPGCNQQPAFTHQGDWFTTARERRGGLKLASANANRVHQNNHRGVCGSVFPNPNNNNPPPTSGPFILFDTSLNTNSVPGFDEGSDVNDISMRQSGPDVVAFIGPGIVSLGVDSLTVWFIDANGTPSVVETFDPVDEPGAIGLPAIDVSAGEQYLITPENSGDVVGEFPSAQ